MWRRKELESYLLNPEVIARLAAAPIPRVREVTDSVTAEMGEYVFGQMLGQRIEAEVSAKRDATQVTSDFKKEFDELWKDAEYRLRVAPAKRVLSGINRRLQEANFRSMSDYKLAAAHRVDEIPPELSGTLRRVEESVGMLRS